MFGHYYKECDICGGDGKVLAPTGQTGSINCPWCLDGRSGPWGDLDFLVSKFDKLIPTWEVASCIDSAEYMALVDAAKDGVKILLSCGFVDMTTGFWPRTTLWAIFGQASITRAELISKFGS